MEREGRELLGVEEGIALYVLVPVSAARIDRGRVQYSIHTVFRGIPGIPHHGPRNVGDGAASITHGEMPDFKVRLRVDWVDDPGTGLGIEPQ